MAVTVSYRERNSLLAAFLPTVEILIYDIVFMIYVLRIACLYQIAIGSYRFRSLVFEVFVVIHIIENRCIYTDIYYASESLFCITEALSMLFISLILVWHYIQFGTMALVYQTR